MVAFVISSGFLALLRPNHNYRFIWIGQVVSEVGDHFNNIAVFSLALGNTGSGLTVAGVLLARGLAQEKRREFVRELL